MDARILTVYNFIIELIFYEGPIIYNLVLVNVMREMTLAKSNREVGLIITSL